MATPTYELIETTTLTSSASSVTFSSITQDYRDLVLVANWKPNTSTDFARWRLNSDTGSNYSRVGMMGNGSSAVSYQGTSTGGFLNAYSDYDSTDFALAILQIMDYSATDKHKTALLRANLADTTVEAIAFRWADTSAVNTLTIDTLNGNQLASGSTFSLYGIA